MALNFYDLPWDLDPDACPCDVHFNEYLEEFDVSGASIFHFGTGAHHTVGLNNAARGNRNRILGITASRAEYDAYMDLVLADAEVAKSYKVLFADLYSLNDSLMPMFDIVTLFHLGEYWIGSGQGMHGDPAPDTPLSDLDVLYLFLDKLKPEGRLLMYSGSAGWPRIEPVIQSALEAGDMEAHRPFRSLRVFSATTGTFRRLYNRLKFRAGRGSPA